MYNQIYFFFTFLVLLFSCNANLGNQFVSEIDYQELIFKNEKGFYNGHLYSGIIFANHPNGKRKYQSTFNEGVDNGEFKEWNEDGILIKISHYKQGKLHGKFNRYYSDGQKHFEVTYNNGEPNGEALEWYSNGQLKLRRIYENGVQNGSYTFWNSTGVKVLDGQMQNDERDGEWYELDEYDNKTHINIYRNGEIISSTIVSN